MLTNASANLSRGPWLVYGPGAAILVTVLCLYLIGDGVRDALDPRLSRS
jgi:peptide/nickel transport system permease protein